MFAGAPALVPCLPMSVVFGVVRDDGVLLVADRASIVPGSWLTATVPEPAGERSKLSAGANGVAVAMAGVTDVGSGIDLFALATEVCSSAPSAVVAAATLSDLFDSVAGSWRASVPAAAGTVAPFEVPVLAVAVVAGTASAGPALYAVGLSVEGPSHLVQPGRSGVAYGPPPVRADVALAAVEAARIPAVDVAAGRLGDAVLAAALSHPGFVSPDWDGVHLGRGAVRRMQHRVGEPRVPYGA